MSTVGKRDNKSKLPYHLEPVLAMEEVMRNLQFGATKYAERNWELGLPFLSGVMASIRRHSVAFTKGEDRDPESGILHAAAIATNGLFLAEFQLRGGYEQFDDRVLNK